MPTRILIAEDNPVVRTTLRHLLEDAVHCEIVEAEDGQQALSKSLELRPNIIILDFIMPAMDGLTVAREISKSLPESAIVMYTMHWSSQLELEGQKFGVQKVVSKADSGALIAAIQQMLQANPPPPLTAVPEPVLPLASLPNPTPVLPTIADAGAVPTEKGVEPILAAGPSDVPSTCQSK